MRDYTELLQNLTAPPPPASFERFLKPAAEGPRIKQFFMRTGMSPVDLYCYLNARYGPPNGFHNALRKDHSDNLFHWHYSLRAADQWVDIMAATYKIEFWIPESFCFSDDPLGDLLSAIKADLRNHGDGLKGAREALEKWFVFANPFYRLQRALSGMLERAGQLLKDAAQKPAHPQTSDELSAFQTSFHVIAEASHEAFGLCRSVRMLIPVVAETFVNLLLYILCKPEVKADERMYESVKRQQIDIRIKSLHLYCNGFLQPVDFASDACKRLHSIFNKRNDLLHGNINPEADMHELVFFKGTVPIFHEWRDFYSRIFAPHLKSDDYALAVEGMNTIDTFVKEVLGCLRENVRRDIRHMLETSELGFNPATKRLGVLFPDVLVDYFIGPTYNADGPTQESEGTK